MVGVGKRELPRQQQGIARVPRPLRLRATLPLLTATLLTATLLTATLAAQDPGPATQNPGTGTAELLAFEEIPVVFTASKFEQKTTEAPAAVSVVTAEDIRRYRYRTLSEILASVRGFYIRDDRNYDGVGVRGFGRPGDYNNRILLLVDGHRINDALYDSAGTDRELVVDVDLIERVEIVRGPGSSLYGSSGFFAVVNVITRQGASVDGAEVSGAVGNFGSRNGRFTFGKEIDGVGFLVSGSYFRMTGERNIFYPAYDDPTTNNGISEANDGETQGNLFAQVRVADFTLQGAFTDRDKQVPTGSYSTVFNDPRNETRDVRYYLDLSYRSTPADAVGVIGRVFLDDYRYAGRLVYDYGTLGNPDLVVNQDGARGAWAGAELQVLLPLDTGHRLTLGTEARVNYQQDQSNKDRAVYLDERSDSYSLGAYVQDELRIGENLILNAGLRLDYYDTFHGTLNPRLAAIYQATAATTVKAIYGRAFRAPTPYELYFNSSTAKASPDLDPETIDTYELVLEQGITADLRASASLFHYRIDGLITQITDTDGLLTFRNVDQIHATGCELELEGRWSDWLRSRASYSFQDSEDVATGSELTNSPRHVAHLQFDAEFAEHWVVATEVNWVAARRTPLGTTAAAYAVANLNLLATDLRPGLELGASVKNVFDHKFENVAGEEHLQDVLEDRGRQLWLQVTYRF